MAFRDGDSGDLGQLGALIIADALETVRSWSQGWFRAHSRKK
jgi:hypothetical protein